MKKRRKPPKAGTATRARGGTRAEARRAFDAGSGLADRVLRGGGPPGPPRRASRSSAS